MGVPPEPSRALPANTLVFPEAHHAALAPYLPTTQSGQQAEHATPHVTLTYATSLDAGLALRPGVQTALSGAQSKAMTHHLRAQHDAILVGAGTAVADDPGLNSRLAGSTHQPRPVVLDPRARWAVSPDARVLATARAGAGLAPWVLVAEHTPYPLERAALLERAGGRVIRLPLAAAASPPDSDGGDTGEDGGEEKGCFSWHAILASLSAAGVSSVMVEGGGAVIADLLRPQNVGLVSSVVVTLAPVMLGRGAVIASPHEPRRRQPADPATAATAAPLPATPAVRFTDVRWTPLADDVVFCGRPA